MSKGPRRKVTVDRHCPLSLRSREAKPAPFLMAASRPQVYNPAMVTPKKGRKVALVAGLALVVLSVGMVWTYWEEIRSWYSSPLTSPMAAKPFSSLAPFIFHDVRP